MKTLRKSALVRAMLLGMTIAATQTVAAENAVYFDGSSSYAEMDSWQPTGSFKVIAWLGSVPTDSSQRTHLLSNSSSAGKEFIYFTQSSVQMKIGDSYPGVWNKFDFETTRYLEITVDDGELTISDGITSVTKTSSTIDPTAVAYDWLFKRSGNYYEGALQALVLEDLNDSSNTRVIDFDTAGNPEVHAETEVNMSLYNVNSSDNIDSLSMTNEELFEEYLDTYKEEEVVVEDDSDDSSEVNYTYYDSDYQVTVTQEIAKEWTSGFALWVSVQNFSDQDFVDGVVAVSIDGDIRGFYSGASDEGFDGSYYYVGIEDVAAGSTETVKLIIDSYEDRAVNISDVTSTSMVVAQSSDDSDEESSDEVLYDLSYTQTVSKDWNSGYKLSVEVENNGTEAFEDGTLILSVDGEITGFYGSSDYAGYDGTYYYASIDTIEAGSAKTMTLIIDSDADRGVEILNTVTEDESDDTEVQVVKAITGEAIDSDMTLYSFDEVQANGVSISVNTDFNEVTSNAVEVQESTYIASSSANNWGGLNSDMYRDGYGGRDREAGENPNTDATITVTSSMSTSEIEDIIQNADDGTTVLFSAGTYVLTETITVNRSNITLKGESQDSVIIDAGGITTDVGRFAFDVRADSMTWQVNESLAKAVTTTSSTVAATDTVVTLASVSSVEVGDLIVFSYEDGDSLNQGGYSLELQSIAEVTGVNTSSNEVTLNQAAGMEFDPNRTDSTNVVYVLDSDKLVSNVVISDFTFQYFTDEEYAAIVDTDTHANQAEEYRDLSAAIRFNGVRSSDILNVLVRNAASSALFVAVGYENYINELTLAGTVNTGGGGNGYGLNLHNSFYSTYENISTTQDTTSRHTVVFNWAAPSSFNKIHVAEGNSNSDFHGGLDFANFVYFEDVVVAPTTDFNFPVMQYRNDQYVNVGDDLNQIQNTIIFDSVETHVAPNGSKLYDDIVYLSANGGVVDTKGGDDIIHSGSGDDEIDVGYTSWNSYSWDVDQVLFYDDSGDDEVLNFGEEDSIGIKSGVNGSSVSSASDVLDLASQSGSDVVLSLGDGNTVTLSNVSLSDLSTNNFFVF